MCRPIRRRCGRRPFGWPGAAMGLAGRGGQARGQSAGEWGVTSAPLRGWLQQAVLEEGQRQDGLTSQEQEELRRRRRADRLFREERELLRKAAACFAGET